MTRTNLFTGQVRRVSFKYEDDPTTSKKRPVVVVTIQNDSNHVLLAKITSHRPRPEFKGEITLNDWETAGLDHRSTVRCSKSIYADAEKVSNAPLLGHLSAQDLKRVIDGLVETGFLEEQTT